MNLKSNILGRFTQNRIYFLDQHLYIYNSKLGQLKESQGDLNSLGRFSICIASQAYFSEYSFTLPLRSERELRQALKLKFQDKQCFYIFKKRSELGFEIKVWEPNISDSKALLFVPLTWLAHFLCKDDKLFEVTAKSGDFFIANKQGVPVSTRRTMLMNHTSTFCQSVGLHNLNVYQIDSKSLCERLIKEGYWYKSADVLRFLNITASNSSKTYSVKDAIPASIVLLGYLALSSAYISWQAHDVESTIAQYQTDVNEALSARAELEENNRRIDILNETLAIETASGAEWLLLEHLATHPGMKITALRFRGGEFTVIGRAPSAIEALALVNNWPLSHEARFSNEVRKSGADESFNISFELKGQYSE